MSHRSIIALAAVSLIPQFPRFAFSSDSATRLELTLLVYNYTALSSGQIAEIRARVAFIIEHAGMRTNWLDCRPIPQNHPVPAPCQQPLGPSNLAIRLLDQTTASKTGSLITPLAHYIASETGGSYANVFCPTVRQFARGNRTSELAYLGHTIAHEIGHLLLGPGAHSNEGIMRARWDKSELRRIAEAQLGLLFPKEQAERLRMCLSARQKSAQDSTIK